MKTFTKITFRPALIFPVLLVCGLSFTGCKTVETFPIPQYPRYAELTRGHYGESMYSGSSQHRQEVLTAYYTFLDTARMDRPYQAPPVAVKDTTATPGILLTLNQK